MAYKNISDGLQTKNKIIIIKRYKHKCHKFGIENDTIGTILFIRYRIDTNNRNEESFRYALIIFPTWGVLLHYEHSVSWKKI